MKKKNVLLVLLATFLVGCDAQQVSSSNLPSSDDSLVGSSNDILEVFTISTGGGDNNLTFSTQTASEGQVVTVTVATVANKRFKKLECDVEGVTFTEVTPNKTYTFVMPSSNVTITAVYATLYSVTSFNSYDSSITGVSCEVGDQFAEGDEVTLSFALMSGSESSIQESISEFYVHINDIVVVPTFDTEMKATFVMPSENIDISVIRRSYGFEEAEEGGVQIICEGDVDYVKFLGFDSTKKYNYSNGSSYIGFVCALGYKYTSVQYKVDDGDWEDVSYVGQGPNGINVIYLVAATSTFSIRVIGEYVGIRNITYVNAEGITSNSGQALPTAIMPGDNVSLYQFVLEDETKYIKSVTATTKDGTAFTEGSLGSNFSGSVSFEMPNEDLTITFEIANKQKVSVVENDKISNVRITNIQSQETGLFQPGDYVYVYFDCENGYKVNQATLSAGSSYVSVSNNYVSFTMPEVEEEIKVTLSVAQIHTVTADFSGLQDSNAMSLQLYGSDFISGDYVSGSININNKFYSLTGLTVKDHNDITISLSGTSFSFTMPDYDVVLVPTFTKADPQNVGLKEPIEDNVLSINVDGEKTGSSKLVYEKGGQNNKMSSDFLPGESLELLVEVSNSEEKIPVVIFDGGDDSTHHYPQNAYYASENSTYYNFAGIELPSTAINIQIILDEKPTFTPSITNDSGAELVYKVNGVVVSDLNSVKLFDDIEISVKEGTEKAYQIVLKDSEGNPIGSQQDGLNWKVDREFSIEVESMHKIHITKDLPSGLSVYGSYSTDGKAIANGETIGRYGLYVDSSSSTAYKVHVVVKMGNKEIINTTGDLTAWGSFYFITSENPLTVTDDIYVEISVVE